MAKNITLDTLELQGANLWVDLDTEGIRLEMSYSVGSSADGLSLSRTREAAELLTAEERTAILDMTARLKGVLEQEELA